MCLCFPDLDTVPGLSLPRHPRPGYIPIISQQQLGERQVGHGNSDHTLAAMADPGRARARLWRWCQDGVQKFAHKQHVTSTAALESQQSVLGHMAGKKQKQPPMTRCRNKQPWQPKHPHGDPPEEPEGFAQPPHIQVKEVQWIAQHRELKNHSNHHHTHLLKTDRPVTSPTNSAQLDRDWGSWQWQHHKLQDGEIHTGQK